MYFGTKRFKLYEVAKYISEINLGALAGVSCLTINKQKWQSLAPPNFRKIAAFEDGLGKPKSLGVKEGVRPPVEPALPGRCDIESL